MVESITTTVRAPSIPVINIHLLESTLITELKYPIFVFRRFNGSLIITRRPKVWVWSPRSTLYAQLFETLQWPQVGASQCGKLSRSVFFGSENQTTGHQVETFHLISQIVSNWIHLFFKWKNRGNSKYHYYVIRVSNRRRRWIKCR
jgi:hypothetical protein